MQRKIVIVEDNVEISDIMRNYLIRAGYVVYQVFDGLQAIEAIEKLKPDLVLLDIMLPSADGGQVCKAIRRSMNFPIIIISAKSQEEDKLSLFEFGADDYMTKPFSFKEMVSRVNAQLRRYYDFSAQNNAVSGIRIHGDLTISPEFFEAKVGDKVINLTAKEFRILDYLTLNSNQILSKQKLIDEVWGINEYIEDNTVAVTIARLREKLQLFGLNKIETVWGFGYKWQE